MIVWERQEPGWYTADGVGGIVREGADRWYFYPAGEAKTSGVGPYRTLRKTMCVAASTLVRARDLAKGGKGKRK